MKLVACVALAFLFTAIPACGTLDGDAGGVSAIDAGMVQSNVNELLAGITDEQSAEAAKGPLDAVVAKLKAALANAADSSGEGAGGEGAGGADSAVAGVLAKFGITAETTTMITGLLDSPAIKEVLGQTLEQLQGLIPAM